MITCWALTLSGQSDSRKAWSLGRKSCPLRTQTMTSFIVNMTMGDVQAGSMTYKSLFAVATCLFVVTLVMNVVSQWVMRRYRESYQ